MKWHASAYLRLRVVGALPASLLALAPQETGGAYRFRLRDYDEVERVLSPLRAAGLHIEDLMIESPDLEDVFVQVMAGASK